MADPIILTQATALGAEHGRTIGSWLVSETTNDEQAATIRQGYESGDPETIALCPSVLSSDWADDPGSVLAELDIDPADADVDAYLAAYDEAFQSGFWEQVFSHV